MFYFIYKYIPIKILEHLPHINYEQNIIIIREISVTLTNYLKKNKNSSYNNYGNKNEI